MPPPSSSPILLLLLFLLFLLGCPEVWSYEAPEDKQDVYARRACPAFLTFTNVAYVSGSTLELPCHCKPSEVRTVVWFFREQLGGSEVTRALTDYHGNRLLDPSHVPHSADLRSRFSIHLFSLLIFRAEPADSGIYICGSVHRDFFDAYDLDIQQVRLSRFVPRMQLFRIFTGYRSWLVCDRCGVPGEQVRMGICYVHTHYLRPRYRRANGTVASCGSGAVPWTLQQLNLNGSLGSLEVRSCQVTCQSRPPPSSSARDRNAFLGLSSDSWPVFHLNHPTDRVLTLGCPGAQPHSAVAWDRESEPIYRFKHWPGSDPGAASLRLVVDSGNHLVFKPAKTEDSGVYYCWLQGHRAAEIRLLVYAHWRPGQPVTSHPDFPAALRTVLEGYGIMTAVFCLLMIGRAGVRLLRGIHNY